MQLTTYLNGSIQRKNQSRRGMNKEKNKPTVENLNPILKVILEGVYDDDSQLSVLRGTPHIVQLIYFYVSEYWKSFISCGDEDNIIEEVAENVGLDQLQPGEVKDFPGNQFVLETIKAKFPPAQELNIQMMPFVLESSFDKCYLPDYLRPYWENMIKPLLRAKNGDCRSEEGKICYLSIYEGFSDTFLASSDRSNLHVRSQRKVVSSQNKESTKCDDKKMNRFKTNGLPVLRLSKNMWNKNLITRYNKVDGGIYVATNTPNLCGAWNSRILVDHENERTDIIGTNGDIRHLRKYIGNRENLKENTIYWITDRTPFEFCPLLKNTYIQYFRLETHQLPEGFEDHSTHNPFGIIPNSDFTKAEKQRNKPK